MMAGKNEQISGRVHSRQFAAGDSWMKRDVVADAQVGRLPCELSSRSVLIVANESHVPLFVTRSRACFDRQFKAFLAVQPANMEEQEGIRRYLSDGAPGFCSIGISGPRA